MKKDLCLLTSLIFALVFSACSPAEQGGSGDSSDEGPISYSKGQSAVQDEQSAKNILQIAIGSPDHKTLVAAVQAAEAEDILVNAGPLTVFAPTDAAFEALPEGTVEELVKPENKAKLKSILYYHAAPGKYTADLLKDGMQLFVASGGKVAIKKDGDKITVNGANVIGTVEATNGLVHVVDGVLLPPEG